MSQLYKDIEALMVLEKSKKVIQDELIVKYDQKRIEGALKYYPEAIEFKKHKSLNRILLACIWIIAIMNAIQGFFALGVIGIIVSFTVPLILIHYISRGKSGGYLAFMVLTFLGLSRLGEGLGEVFQEGDVFIISMVCLYIGSFIVGFILSYFLRKDLFPYTKA